MQIKTSYYFGILMACAIVLGNTVLSFADNELQVEVISVVASETPDDLTLPAFDPVKEQEDFLKKLDQELSLSKTEYRQILTNISDTQRRLDLVTKQKNTLADQLAALDDSINLTTKKLIDAVYQMVQAENEITLIYDQIQVKEIALEEQKNLLKDYVRILYEQEKTFLEVDENGELQAFKLLLADDTVGNNLRQWKYFGLLSEAGQQMVDRLDKLSRELVLYKEKVKSDRIRLQQLKDRLSSEKKALEEQKQSKENLLKITSGQEEIYAQLLLQSLKEQQQALDDVKGLNSAINQLQGKISNGENFDIAQYENLLDNRTLALYKFQLENRDQTLSKFVWPVEPTRGLTAYFHDAGYKNTFGMQHNAIDIPTLQGSLVRSAADGVVYKTKDNGYGYSYIIVAHTGGYMSVYGHVSGILVSEGDTVKQGAILGLSGGMPGTKGAGYMTTGPHLHFELLANGDYVDPLDYLPINMISFESIQALPKEYQDAWREAVSILRESPVER